MRLKYITPPSEEAIMQAVADGWAASPGYDTPIDLETQLAITAELVRLLEGKNAGK